MPCRILCYTSLTSVRLSVCNVGGMYNKILEMGTRREVGSACQLKPYTSLYVAVSRILYRPIYTEENQTIRVEFCTSIAIISATNGSRVALSQHLLIFLLQCKYVYLPSRSLWANALVNVSAVYTTPHALLLLLLLTKTTVSLPASSRQHIVSPSSGETLVA